MVQRDLVIGLDSSTTASKAIVWDLSGNQLAEGRAGLSMEKPRPGWHEQPAETWWEAAAQALRQVAAQVDPTRFAAISIATQRETFVITGEDGHPLCNALLWMDERARDMLPFIESTVGRQRIHAETGKPLSANLTLAKLFWMRENQPDLFKRIERVLDVHAFLAYHLTGRFATSYGCADPMGLFDMRRNEWHAGLIQAIGLRVDQFPEALPVGSLIGEVTSQAATQCGLPAGLPLIAGLGDGQAAGLGASVSGLGDAYLNLGTAVVSGTFSERYLVDQAFRTMVGGVPGSYMLETVLLGGTYTIAWFIENFYRGDKEIHLENPSPELLLEKAAEKIPAGAQGLLLVPYWNSVMNPYWDASASGMVVGWRGIHTQAHFYRAILEGIAFELRLQTNHVENALGQAIRRLIAVGGGSRSPLWCQILADITGKPIYRAGSTEATALGAGILAASSLGVFSGVGETVQAMARLPEQHFEPDPSRHAFYSRLYEDVYSELYPSLRSALGKLAEFDTQKDTLNSAPIPDP